MRAYTISIMTICTFTLAITFLTLLGSIRTYVDPESDLSGYEYKKYLSFEYYKQQELEFNTDKKNPLYLASLTEENWKDRWTLHRETAIAETLHKEKSAFFYEFIYLFLFSLLLVIHIYLYKKFSVKYEESL